MTSDSRTTLCAGTMAELRGRVGWPARLASRLLVTLALGAQLRQCAAQERIIASRDEFLAVVRANGEVECSCRDDEVCAARICVAREVAYSWTETLHGLCTRRGHSRAVCEYYTDCGVLARCGTRPEAADDGTMRELIEFSADVVFKWMEPK